jgi:hypothetical protein
MRFRPVLLSLAAMLPCTVVAQATQQAAAASTNPVTDAFRMQTSRYARIIPAAAELMPAEKYGYKPTPAQLSFGEIVVHLIEANDGLCALVAGTKAAAHPELKATSAKDSLVAQLKSSFDFCTTSFATLKDDSLATPMSMYGMSGNRAFWFFVNVADWSDHYSQFANYMRLNGVLPPTARPRPATP